MSEKATARKLKFMDLLVYPDPAIHKPEPIKIDYSKVKVIERVKSESKSTPRPSLI